MYRYNLYMDDPLNSVENTEKAREFWHEAVRIFKDGGFNLRKFRSNDENLLHEFSGTQVQQLHKVLGVSWDLKSDELLPLVDLEDMVPKKLTKREVLSCLSKIYDPCGLVSPAVTPLKIIVLDCWKATNISVFLTKRQLQKCLFRITYHTKITTTPISNPWEVLIQSKASKGFHIVQ